MLYIFRRSSLSLSLLAVLFHHPCQYHLHSSCPLLLSPSFLAFSSSLTAPPSLSFFSLLVLFYSPSLALFFLGLPLLYASLGTSSCPSVTLVTLIFFFFFTFVLSYGPRLYRSSIILPSPFSFFTLHCYPPRSFLSSVTLTLPLLVAIICYSPCPPFLPITTILLSSLFSTWPHSPILPSSPRPLPHPPVFTSPPPSSPPWDPSDAAEKSAKSPAGVTRPSAVRVP